MESNFEHGMDFLLSTGLDITIAIRFHDVSK